jgi:YebC/PmpR family DNA-binding regulatory protein
MAGHSKWANIQHRKGRQDAARSKLFLQALQGDHRRRQDGRPRPRQEPAPAAGGEGGQGHSVPKDVIERAIKKPSPATRDYEEIRYEGYGPNGVAVIVEAMTDNRNRTASTVRSTFSKHGGNLGETGSVASCSSARARSSTRLDVGDADTVMMAAIEAGAEDVESSEDGHIIWCADTDLNEVSDRAGGGAGRSESTKLVWKPTTTTELGLDGCAEADEADRRAGRR